MLNDGMMNKDECAKGWLRDGTVNKDKDNEERYTE